MDDIKLPKLTPEGERRLVESTTWDDYFQEKMKDIAFKKRWEARASERELRKAIISLRIEHKLTQEDLAKKLKTAQANVSKWETGKVTPSIEILDKIAKTFGKELRIAFH